MRLTLVLAATALAMPALAQTPDCERLTARIKTQQEQAFRLNVTAAQAGARGNSEAVDARLQALALLVAVQSNIQLAAAARCELGGLVVGPDPEGADAAQCGARIRAAMQQNDKAKLAAAYRLPACGGLYEEQAKQAEADAAKAAERPRPAARPKAGFDQEEWRRRVNAWTARRAECRAAYPDNERAAAECAGPIPEPRR